MPYDYDAVIARPQTKIRFLQYQAIYKPTSLLSKCLKSTEIDNNQSFKK